jgi:hypothetical protein
MWEKALLPCFSWMALVALDQFSRALMRDCMVVRGSFIDDPQSLMFLECENHDEEEQPV